MSETYVDGTTPLNAVHMNALQQKVEKGAPSGYVGLNGSSGIDLAAGAIVKWGGDTTLYRSAGNALKTDGSLSAAGPYFMTGAVGGQGAGVRYISGAGSAASWYMNAATGGNI